MFVRHAALSLVLAFSLIACAKNADQDEDADDATASTTSALQAQSQVGLVDAVTEVDGGAAPEAEEAARMVVEGATKNLQPEGCLTKTREGSVVTFESKGCTGPFGKVAVYGTLVATFSKTTPDVLHVALATKDGATSNGAAFDYGSDTDIRFDGAARIFTYHGHSSGTTARGKSFSRSTDLTVSVDTQAQCLAIDGTSHGTIGKYDVDLTIEGFHACRNACPTAGIARATVDGPLVKDASITVTFDGSDTAHVQVHARRDRDRSVKMDCEAGEAE
jgi:hypothetical protein